MPKVVTPDLAAAQRAGTLIFVLTLHPFEIKNASISLILAPLMRFSGG
ncbi:hypothetical protein DHBDCA_p1210 [Dehalobacter sp. DCA]|nr:hypothetical protein DHBDCA_p1210 [Dehalobacter sp. DCA]